MPIKNSRSMENTVSFSILKEKIIKTSELLGVVLEKNKSLTKSQKWIQHLKTRIELNKNEVNKLKLRNDTLTSNLRISESKYESLKNEHDHLQEKFLHLENESASVINNLQVNYQLTNKELQECKEKLVILEAKNGGESLDTFPNRRRKSPTKRKKSPVKNRKSDDTLLAQLKINELQLEKEKLQNEKSDLQLQVFEMKKELDSLKQLYDAKNHNQEEGQDLKSRYESRIKSKENEISRLAGEIKVVQKEKEKLLSENESLKLERSLEEQEVETVREKQNQIFKTKEKEVIKLSNEMKNREMEVTKLKCENKQLKEAKNSLQLEVSILQNTITENAKQTALPPIEDEVPKLTSVPPVENEICRLPLFPLTNKDSVATIRENAKSPTDEEIAEILKQMRTPTQVSPFTDSCERVNDKAIDWQIRIDRKRQIVRERRKNLRKLRKGARHIDLYGALLALKRANINFVISNDSVIKSNYQYADRIMHKRLKYKDIEKRKVKTITKELVCNLDCCKDNFMVMKKDESLIGFVGVKNEDASKVIETFDLTKCSSEYEKSSNETTEVLESRKANNSTNEEIETVEPNFLNTAPLNDQTSNNEPVKSTEKKLKSKRGRKPLVAAMKKRKVVKPIKFQPQPFEVVEEDLSESRSSPISETVFKKPVAPVLKSPKTAFKRPICRTRKSPRLTPLIETTPTEFHQSQEAELLESPESPPTAPQEDDPYAESPQSPLSATPTTSNTAPVVIPLEKKPETLGNMPTSKVESLFNKLILYSKEEEALNEVVQEFKFQEPDYIAGAILQRVAADYHTSADTKYSPAPLMTDVQRTMLGFMSRLEKSNVAGVFDSYLSLAELRLLTSDNLLEMGPITRLYLAVCKLRKNLSRMRKLCCDVFYFCGDLAVPFFFTVLTSWTEVLPHEADSKNFPIARVLVQLVYTKECNKPGYNYMPLRDLLIKFYNYPSERWEYNEFFKELFDKYLENPSLKSSEFALLLYCKNRPEKWVHERIEEHFKPLVALKIQDNFKATLIVLIGNLYNRFSSKSDPNYLPQIRDWFLSLIKDDASDVVKRCVYLCLNRLKKK